MSDYMASTFLLPILAAQGAAMLVHTLPLKKRKGLAHDVKDTLHLFFHVLFLFDWVGVLWPQSSKVLKLVRWASSVPFPPLSLQRQVVCCCGRCSCVHLRGEPVSSYFSMACCSVVSY